MFSKKKSSKSAIKNILTLNAYNNKHYVLKNDSFQPLKKLTYDKSNFTTSYIGNKDLITATVMLSRSIPEEDVSDILDIKAYEELGLDQAISYSISYYEVNTEKEEREFHIFVVEYDVLDSMFLPLKKETKYIDLIVPAPLLFKPLYSKGILQDNKTHCFVYFTQDDAFVTLYQDGKYLYSKSIEFSLEQIYDKYCALVGEKANEKDFYTVLETEGLKCKDEATQQHFMKIFGDVFITINDIIIYTKRAFNLESIDQIFIGSQRGAIIGLDDYSQNYLGLNSSEFNFNYNVANEEWYTDQLHYLMLLSSFDYMEDESSFVNLTMYPRPPSFLKRASGQFIVSMIAAVTLSLAYPLSYLIKSYANDAEMYALTSKNNNLSAISSKYKKILGEKKSKIKVLDKESQALAARYFGKTKTLSSIYNKKVNYRLKSGLYHSIAEELDKFGVKVSNIHSEENTLWVDLVSEEDRSLTELIKYISEKHFDEVNSIDIKRIQKDSEDNFYKGLLKVELK